MEIKQLETLRKGLFKLNDTVQIESTKEPEIFRLFGELLAQIDASIKAKVWHEYETRRSKEEG